MNHITAELDQTDEDILYEVSDETLEGAAGHLHRRPIHEDCWTNGRDGGMRLTWKIKDRRSPRQRSRRLFRSQQSAARTRTCRAFRASPISAASPVRRSSSGAGRYQVWHGPKGNVG
jgi:hypothetical protein